MKKIRVNIHVLTLYELSQSADIEKLSKIIRGYHTEKGSLTYLLSKEYEDVIVQFDYPLSKKFETIIPKAKRISDILIPLAIIYKKEIYGTKEKMNEYGVWGHELSDLYFESIEEKENNTLYISMGS